MHLDASKAHIDSRLITTIDNGWFVDYPYVECQVDTWYRDTQIPKSTGMLNVRERNTLLTHSKHQGCMYAVHKMYLTDRARYCDSIGLITSSAHKVRHGGVI